jgi:hypothetical protein
MVLLYDNKYLEHPRNLMMHSVGKYEINYVTYGGVVSLHDLAGKDIQGMVNGS